MFGDEIILLNILVTPKLVKQIITILDLSKVPGPDSIPVVVMKNYEPEFSYILTELSMCLKYQASDLSQQQNLNGLNGFKSRVKRYPISLGSF